MDPLFVEEMTKAVLEAENQDAARRTVGKVSISCVRRTLVLARIADCSARLVAANELGP